MNLRRNVFCKFLALFSIFIVLGACAPKKVRLYDVPSATRNNVAMSALSLQGKPYRNGARGPDSFDCSGLVHYVFKLHHVSLPPPAEAQGRAGYEINRDSAQPGDLVLFRIDGDSHIGIVVGGDEFVHASKSRGVIIDNVNTDYWRKRLVGYRSVL
jgi:cell wall-associated NlpC family hydrolase